MARREKEPIQKVVMTKGKIVSISFAQFLKSPCSD